MSKTKSHVPPEVSAYMAANGHKGGSTTKKTQDPDYYKKISAIGLAKRWSGYVKPLKRIRKKATPVETTTE